MIVPAHGVHVCQRDFLGKGRMVLMQERVEILVLEEVLLLDDLGIDIGRS